MKLATRMCDECLFSPGRIVGAERMKEIVRETERKDTHFICHKSAVGGFDGEDLHGDPVICRGFYDAFPGRGQLVRIMGRLGAIEEVEVG